MSHPESPESPVSEETELLAVVEDRQAKEDKLVSDKKGRSDVDPQDESVSDRMKPRSPQRRWLPLGVTILIVASASLGWRWWQSSRSDNPLPASATGGRQDRALPVKLTAVETVTIRDASELVGTLEAPRATTLKPEIDGRISELLVREGDRVRSGQIVARLDSQDLQAQLEQSQAELEQAEALLAERQAGSRPEEIAQGQSRLAQAQASLQQAQNGSRPEEIAQGQSRLAQAQASLQQAQNGSRPEEIAQGQSRLAQAQANLEQARNNRPQQLEQAQARVDSAQAQATLTEVRFKRYQSLQQEGAISQDKLDEVRADNKTALANLEEARRNLQQLQIGTQQDIAQKQAAVNEARQALQQLQNGTRPEEIAQKQAAVNEARQALQQLQNGTRPEEIAQKQAAVNEARQALQQLQNGTRPEEIAQARSQVAQAAARVRVAAVQLQKTKILAPFIGTVGDIPVRIGDFVSKGDELTTITTNNLLELNLSIPLNRSSQLRLGLPVEMLDAQNKPIATGNVNFISPNVDANSQTVLAKATFSSIGRELLDRQSVRARIIWNESSGIAVPVNAISRIGGQTFVFVADRTSPSQLVARQKSVKLGDIQGNNYQVLEGLQAGEEVITAGLLNLTDGAAIALDNSSPSNN